MCVSSVGASIYGGPGRNIIRPFFLLSEPSNRNRLVDDCSGLQMAPSVSSMDSGKTPIEPAEGTPESDEFDFVSDWDKLSIPPRDAGSNVWQHVYEGGRRYHLYKHGRYPIPNDETEQDREDMKHAMMMELCVSAHIHLENARMSSVPNPDIGRKTVLCADRGLSQEDHGHWHRDW